MKRLLLAFCIVLLVALIIIGIYQKIGKNQGTNIVDEQISTIAAYIN